MAVDAQLLADVKNYLDITWTDADSDAKVSGMIARGEAYLDEVAGTSLDYSAEDLPRALLFDYIRYARAAALDDFAKNYVAELLTLQLRREVADATG
jgi:hypothetical protein